MQRLSKTGELAASMSLLLDSLASAAESEMQEVFADHEYDDAQLRAKFEAEIDALAAARDAEHQQVIRAGQQLRIANAELSALNAKLAQASGPDMSAVRDARAALMDSVGDEKLSPQLKDLLLALDKVLPKVPPVPAPSLAEVAEAAQERDAKPAA